MQYGRFTVAPLGCKKSSHLDCPAEGCCLQPAGRFAQGQYSNFHFHQAQCTTFSLRGAVLQASFADRYSGWRVAQCFALDQLARESDAVQPSVPV